MCKRFTYFLLIAGVFLLALNLYAQPEKMVLFEQHTGAWCGWCVDGTHKLEQVMEAYPDKVIPVKIHSGDGK